MLTLLLSLVLSGVLNDEEILKRGDVNHSGSVNISDANYLANYLYQGGPAPPCLNEADANFDGHVDGADISYLTSWLFSSGPAPPSPGPFNSNCTTTTKHISCNSGC